MYRNTLSKKEIEYTETVCGQELNWLNYEFQNQGNKLEIIKKFKDYGLYDPQHLPSNFSSTEININFEIRRLSEFKNFYSASQS
jgi:hypothetical protein